MVCTSLTLNDLHSLSINSQIIRNISLSICGGNRGCYLYGNVWYSHCVILPAFVLRKHWQWLNNRRRLSIHFGFKINKTHIFPYTIGCAKQATVWGYSPNYKQATIHNPSHKTTTRTQPTRQPQPNPQDNN